MLKWRGCGETVACKVLEGICPTMPASWNPFWFFYGCQRCMLRSWIDDMLCLQVLGRTRVMPSNGTETLRGVFSIEPEADLSSATVYLETAHPGFTFDFQTPKFHLASDLSSKSMVPNLPNVTDDYSPCAIMPDHGYTVVYSVELPQGSNSSDNLNIFMCSPGGYDQVWPPVLVMVARAMMLLLLEME